MNSPLQLPFAAASVGFDLLLVLFIPLLAVLVLGGIAAGAEYWSKRRHPEAPHPDLTALSKASAEISPETMALIAAAVWATFGARARVMRVRETFEIESSPDAISTEWSREGRRDIYASHHLH